MTDAQIIEKVARAIAPSAWAALEADKDTATFKKRRATSLRQAERAVAAYRSASKAPARQRGTPSPTPLYPNSVGSPEVAHFQLIRWDEDPNYLSSVTYLGMKEVEWVDNDDSNAPHQPVYLYRCFFTDSTPVDIRVDGDFTEANAKRWADILAQRLGVQPKIDRDNTFHYNFVKGDGGAFAESSGHFIFLYESRAILRLEQNKLEETMFHEGKHMLQETGSGRGYNYLASPEWSAAVEADGAYITTYAMKNAQEDFAESALFAYAVIFHPERLGVDLGRVENQIWHRIGFFRKVFAA